VIDLEKVSKEALHLLRLMLLTDPKARPSASQCLKMPFFERSQERGDLAIGSNLASYDSNFQANLKNRQDVGLSEELKSTGVVAVNGKTDTAGSVDINSHPNVNGSSQEKQNLSKSHFGVITKPRAGTIDQGSSQ